MCINVYKIILLVCMCCVGICWISCSGNSDDSEQTEVILSVDKNTLTADGKDIITFTVMHAGIDVTADAIIRSVMDGQTLDGNTFSTSKAGTYAFEASYGNYVSKLITVVAKVHQVQYPICETHLRNGVHRNMVRHVSGRNDPSELFDKFELRGNCLSDVISC